MKKLMLLLVFAVPLSQAWAQPTGEKKRNVQIEVEDNRVIIEGDELDDLSGVDLNSIINEITRRAHAIQKQHNELMAQVDKQLANGEITEEEAEEMREMINDRTEESMDAIGELMDAWGESYEARMDAWEEEYEAEMEAWEEEVERRAESGNFSFPPLPPLPPIPPAPAPSDDGQSVIIDEDGIRITDEGNGKKTVSITFDEDEMDHKHEERRYKATKGYGDFHIGFNQMLRGGTEFINDGIEELNFWGSNAIELGTGAKTRIGSQNSVFYIKYGAEVSWHDFKLQDARGYLDKDANMSYIAPDTLNNVSYSKFKTVYINIPVMLQLDFSKNGKRDDAFTIGAGGYAGIRADFKRKLCFSDGEFNDAKELLKDRFFSNQYRYGVMGQIGFDAFKITVKYDLNKFFQKNNGPDYQLAMISLGWTI